MRTLSFRRQAHLVSAEAPNHPVSPALLRSALRRILIQVAGASVLEGFKSVKDEQDFVAADVVDECLDLSTGGLGFGLEAKPVDGGLEEFITRDVGIAARALAAFPAHILNSGAITQRPCDTR